MTIEGKAVLVTGANRGIGRALVEEALSRGAKRVYAGTRHPFAHPDERVIPLMLDVTNNAQIDAVLTGPTDTDMTESWRGGMANALVHEYAAFVQAPAAA
jgi:NAD(P)-dependent dehydrogenase (short-subunit alcohol dehydrogenase family)